MKKKILVPVDFSANAKNAFEYASRLAVVMNRELEIVHIDNGKSNEDLNTKLTQFCQFNNINDSYELLTKTKITPTIVKGKVIDVLLKMSQKREVAMMIMGAAKDHNEMERLFGSVSSLVAQRAACPVMLIPEKVKYRDYEHILFASDYHTADEEMIEKIMALGNLFRAMLHFIHVVEPEEDANTFIELEERIFNLLFKEGDPAFPFNIAAIAADDIMSGLYHYANKNKIDLMVLVNQHRDFASSVLGKSVTKKVVHNLKWPVVVFHI